MKYSILNSRLNIFERIEQSRRNGEKMIVRQVLRGGIRHKIEIKFKTKIKMYIEGMPRFFMDFSNGQWKQFFIRFHTPWQFLAFSLDVKIFLNKMNDAKIAASSFKIDPNLSLFDSFLQNYNSCQCLVHESLYLDVSKYF